jgi:AmiR/NasT family two-component response regulator
MVGLVTGTLMHRRGISADEAFDLLHDLSQRLNARLADLDEPCDQVDS